MRAALAFIAVLRDIATARSRQHHEDLQLLFVRSLLISLAYQGSETAPLTQEGSPSDINAYEMRKPKPFKSSHSTGQIGHEAFRRGNGTQPRGALTVSQRNEE